MNIVKFIFFYIYKRENSEDRAMGISNIHETLLMYTKQKNRINEKLSEVMFDMMSATRNTAELQKQYNQKCQNAYYDPVFGYGTDEYMIILEGYENDHEFDLAILNSWESELEMEKNDLETQLNEITAFESSWTKLLQNNVKKDFTYGSVS